MGDWWENDLVCAFHFILGVVRRIFYTFRQQVDHVEIHWMNLEFTQLYCKCVVVCAIRTRNQKYLICSCLLKKRVKCSMMSSLLAHSHFFLSLNLTTNRIRGLAYLINKKIKWQLHSTNSSINGAMIGRSQAERRERPNVDWYETRAEMQQCKVCVRPVQMSASLQYESISLNVSFANFCMRRLQSLNSILTR